MFSHTFVSAHILFLLPGSIPTVCSFGKILSILQVSQMLISSVKLFSTFLGQFLALSFLCFANTLIKAIIFLSNCLDIISSGWQIAIEMGSISTFVVLSQSLILSRNSITMLVGWIKKSFVVLNLFFTFILKFNSYSLLKAVITPTLQMMKNQMFLWVYHY